MIDGDFFQSVAHVTYSDNMELHHNYGNHPDISNVIMYAKTEDQDEALQFIRGWPRRKFVLITHNSDKCSETLRVLPRNIVKWYACNMTSTQPYPTLEKMEPIPIGFENTRWHIKKRDILKRVKKEFDQDPVKRSLTPFACFNPKTHPQERENLQHLINNGHIDANTENCVNGVNYEEYIRNLFTHRFCLCPRGNGIDTHRVWEALYCGCIPIIKPYSVYRKLDWETGLTGVLQKANKHPVMTVSNWLELTEDNLLKAHLETPEFTNSDIPMLTTKFWQDKIERSFEDAD